MSSARFIIILLLAALGLSGWGCVMSGGSGSGQVILDSGQPSPKGGPGPGASQAPGESRGHEVAARNHLRSAYRFLEKGKPDHAQKELEKARGKAGEDFWFHYYLGGALFLQGKNREAGSTWEMAFRYTRDAGLRSRVRTCQSFAVYRTEGSSSSVGFLQKALDLDGENLTARDLFQEMAGSGGTISQKKGQGASKKPGKSSDSSDGGKSKGPKKKIEGDQEFREYFLIEIPAD